MNIARKHHFVPQSYLAGFTDDGKLTVFDLESRKTFRTTPRKVATKRDFNRIDVHGLPPDAVEQALGDFEGRAISTIRRLQEREGLSLPELFTFFPDDATAEKWFEKQRWPNGIACPECGSLRYAVVKNRKPMPDRCKDCRKYFSVRKGMVMQSSKLGYQK